MKTFKQFMLESGETGRAINTVNVRQTFPLYGQGSTLPAGLTLEPLNNTRNKVVSKPKPSAAAKPTPKPAAKPAPWWNPKLPSHESMRDKIYNTLTGNKPKPSAVAKPTPKR